MIVGVDPDPGSRRPCQGVGASRTGMRCIRTPWAVAYVNMLMDDEGQERVRTTYRENYDRLAEIKAKYDPDNLFHVNQNIRPA